MRGNYICKVIMAVLQIWACVSRWSLGKAQQVCTHKVWQIFSTPMVSQQLIKIDSLLTCIDISHSLPKQLSVCGCINDPLALRSKTLTMPEQLVCPPLLLSNE